MFSKRFNGFFIVSRSVNSPVVYNASLFSLPLRHRPRRGRRVVARYFTNRRVLDGSRGIETKRKKKGEKKERGEGWGKKGGKRRGKRAILATVVQLTATFVRSEHRAPNRVMNNNQLLLPGRAINTQLTNTPSPCRNKGCHA